MYDSYLKHIEEFWEKDTTIDRIDNDWITVKKTVDEQRVKNNLIIDLRVNFLLSIEWQRILCNGLSI